jgi:hypothetical protein
MGPFTSFGYGFFDEIPAAYVLKYLDFQTCMNFVKCNLWTWKNGTQSIYEALNSKLQHPAVLNSQISKVVRSEKNVTLTVNGKEEVFDKLIVTSPLQYFPDYADATPVEKELFSKIDFERYDVLALTMKEGQYPVNSYYIMQNMVPERLGHLMVYYRRWKNEPNQAITTYALRNHRGTPKCRMKIARRWCWKTSSLTRTLMTRCSMSIRGITSRTSTPRIMRRAGTIKSKQCKVSVALTTPAKSCRLAIWMKPASTPAN